MSDISLALQELREVVDHIESNIDRNNKQLTKLESILNMTDVFQSVLQESTEFIIAMSQEQENDKIYRRAAHNLAGTMFREGWRMTKVEGEND